MQGCTTQITVNYYDMRPNFDRLKFQKQKLNIDSFTIYLLAFCQSYHANNNYMYNRDTSSTDIVQHSSIHDSSDNSN